jgi:hypothetical protein
LYGICGWDFGECDVRKKIIEEKFNLSVGNGKGLGSTRQLPVPVPPSGTCDFAIESG